MSNEQPRDLLQRGIQAAKTGQKDEARQLLQQYLRLVPNNDTAWLLLGSVARNNREKLLCIQKALEINPDNETAIKALQAMGIDPARLRKSTTEEEAVVIPPESVETQAPVFSEDVEYEPYDEYEDIDVVPPGLADEPPAAAQPMYDDAPAAMQSDGSGIPIPDARSLRYAEELADQIIQGYLQEREARPNITWVHKQKRRAGESEILVLRLQVATAIAVFLVILGGIGVFAVNNSPEVQLVLFGATETPVPPTRTPTNTPTNTPGFTATPSPTVDFTQQPTYTASPTFSLIGVTAVAANPQVSPVPTEIYLPEVPNRAVLIADEALNDKRPEEAIPLLENARAQLGNTFNSNPYYYEALAYLEQGEFSAAFNLLTDAESRLDLTRGIVTEEQANRYQPWIDVAFAQYHLAQAREALETSNQAFAEEQLNRARERANSARSRDPRLAQSYLVLAEVEQLEGDFEGAIEALELGQTQPAIANDLNLTVAKGYVYLNQGRRQLAQGNLEAARATLEQAKYQGEYAVFLNPFSQDAHQLQVEVALALNDPGLAVIRSQGYLLYFQNNAEAFKRLGDARVAEGNNDLALEAYSSALDAEGGSVIYADVLISRAALFSQQRRYDLAQQDLSNAIEYRSDFDLHRLRMYAAYNAGDYETAQEDIDLLTQASFFTDEALLMRARILIDEGEDTNRALSLLNNLSGVLPAVQRPVADEYLARAHYELGNLGDALNAINRALAAVETGSRHYLRGLIHEARGERQDAIAEYQWVLTWDRVYNYDFADDARQRVDRILAAIAEEQAQATATAITATAEAVQATETAEAAIIQTAQAVETVTATAGVPLTETADARETATVTAGVPLTETMQARETATVTAGVPLTETVEARETATATAGEALTATADTRATETATFAVQITETAEANLTSTAFVEEMTAAADATDIAATQAAEATPEPE